MSSTISVVAAALLLAISAPTKHETSRPMVSLPEAVLPHPVAGLESSVQSAPPSPRWSAQALAEWAGPWGPTPGGYYDHRYVTW
jgi:hypothetical protein